MSKLTHSSFAVGAHFKKHSLIIIAALFVVACSSAPLQPAKPISVEPYQVERLTTDRLKQLMNMGSVSGASSVVSDKLLKTSLPCRTLTFSMPENKRVATYIEDALKGELEKGGKLDKHSPKVDIIINRLESDTKQGSAGSWNLDFTYKLGKKTYNVKTSTEFPTASDTQNACEGTAGTLNGALKANFMKFFDQT